MSEQQSNIEVHSMLPVGTVLNGKYGNGLYRSLLYAR